MKPFGSTIRTLLLLGLVGQVSVNCYADRNSNLLPRIGEMKRACEAPPSLWDRILGRTPASLEAPSPELGLPWGQVNQRMAMKEALNHPGLLGLGEGDRCEFTLLPEEAFGPRNPELIQRVSRATLAQNSQLGEDYSVGDVVEFNAPGGGRFAGVLREVVGDDTVFDFNHPLAGQSLTFKVHIIGIL